MATTKAVRFTIDVDGNAAARLKDLKGQMRKLSGRWSTEARVISRASDIAKNSILGMSAAAAGLGVYALKSAADLESMSVALKTAMGGNEQAANDAFNVIKEFTAKTPFQLEEVMRSFVKLKNMGLDPSERSLRSYGDTASAMGKSLNDMVEAVADAATGEFERLKEFGIRASQEGDRVTFTFKGVETTVQKNAEAIQNYLLELGETEFAGGMEAQSQTLTGRLSTLKDAFQITMASIAEESGVLQMAKDATKSLTETIENNKSVLIAYAQNAVNYAKDRIMEWYESIGGKEGLINIFNQFKDTLLNKIIPAVSAFVNVVKKVIKYVIENWNWIWKLIVAFEALKALIFVGGLIKSITAIATAFGAVTTAIIGKAGLAGAIASLPMMVTIGVALLGFAKIMEQIKGIDNALDSIEGDRKNLDKMLSETTKKYKEAEGEEKERYAGQLKAIQKAYEENAKASGSILDSLSLGFGKGNGGSARAMGGTVIAGKSYTVGERGPETFVPTETGRIVPTQNSGGATFNFNFQGAMIADKSQLISEIRNAINRESELSRFGIG